MAEPLVSVVIAVKDGERYLASAIRSILEQQYHPLEIIVVDGQSEDETAKIAHSFREVGYIRQAGRGIPDAYNVGIEASAGELIAFLSHDDLWTPDKLSVQVPFMCENPSLLYTIAKVRFFLEPGSAIPQGFRPELLSGEHVGRIMETFMARPRAFELVGGYCTDLSVSEDVDWFSRANDLGIPMAIIPQVLLRKRIHSSNSSLSDASMHNQNLLAVLRRSVERKRGDRLGTPRDGSLR